MEWISVKEKLPRGDRQVLCYSTNNGGYSFISPLGTYDGRWIRSFKITHWMPLPECPNRY